MDIEQEEALIKSLEMLPKVRNPTIQNHSQIENISLPIGPIYRNQNHGCELWANHFLKTLETKAQWWKDGAKKIYFHLLLWIGTNL